MLLSTLLFDYLSRIFLASPAIGPFPNFAAPNGRSILVTSAVQLLCDLRLAREAGDHRRFLRNLDNIDLVVINTQAATSAADVSELQLILKTRRSDRSIIVSAPPSPD